MLSYTTSHTSNAERRLSIAEIFGVPKEDQLKYVGDYTRASLEIKIEQLLPLIVEHFFSPEECADVILSALRTMADDPELRTGIIFVMKELYRKHPDTPFQ